MKNEITIVIIEENGRVGIHGVIPDGAENSVAGALAEQLLAYAAECMNMVTGQKQQIVKIASH